MPEPYGFNYDGSGFSFGDPTSNIGFYGAIPVPRRTGASQVAVTTATATNASPWGYATSTQANALVTLVNEMRAVLVGTGLMRGS